MKITDTEFNLFLFIYRILEKCLMKIVIFSPHVRDHYKNVHNITDSNFVFDQYLDNLSSNSVVILTSQSNFYNNFFHGNRTKAKHLVKELLKLFNSNVNNLLIIIY